MEKSEQIDQLATALAKAQAALDFARQTGTNPHFRSEYSTLADIWESCRKPLSDAELAVIQLPGNTDVGIVITTVLVHSSGQWISSCLEIPIVQPSAQATGSAITYGRRYGLAAMVGIAPADDDGNEAERAKPQNPRQATAGKAGPAVTKPPRSLVDEALALGATAEGERQFCPDHPDIALVWYEPKGKPSFWGHTNGAGQASCRFSPMELGRVRATKAQEATAELDAEGEIPY